MNGCFQWNVTFTFHLGPTAELKLFTVSVHASVFGNKPSLILYDGPTKEDPVLATLKSDKWGRARPVDITLFPRPQGHHTHAIDLQMVPASTSRVSPTFTFEIQGKGKGAGRERFEWRKNMETRSRSLPLVIPMAGSLCGCRALFTVLAGAGKSEKWGLPVMERRL